MQRSFTMLAVVVVVAALLAVGFAMAWYERPTHLTVAIAKTDAEDTAVIGTAAKLLKFGRNAVRLRTIGVDGPAAAAAMVDAGKADLAVIRTDLALPDDAQTVVILHRDAALLTAPGGGEVRSVADLAGHKLGIVHRGPGIDAILATALAQYDIRPDTVTLVGLAPEEVAEAVKSKAVDAVLAVDVLSSPHLRDIVRAVAAGGEGAPVLVPIAEADAIAQRSPGYEKLEVVRGAFGGTPPRPADEYDTLSITHRLVANENVSQDLISDLTRFFLTEKMQIAASAPIARRIEAPSTDKGLTLPAHAGSAAYIDDDEQTFFDKYSDFIYIGAMLLGVVASGGHGDRGADPEPPHGVARDRRRPADRDAGTGPPRPLGADPRRPAGRGRHPDGGCPAGGEFGRRRRSAAHGLRPGARPGARRGARPARAALRGPGHGGRDPGPGRRIALSRGPCPAPHGKPGCGCTAARGVPKAAPML